jgi:outer membrane biosynthesis protein TonB
MTWTLHLVGQESEETLQGIVTEIVAKVESEGHTLLRAILSTDGASRDLDVSGVVEPTPDAAPVQTPQDEQTPDPDPEPEVEPEVPTDTPPSL